MILKLNSPQIHCDGCRKNITKTLKHLKGVKVESVDLATKDIVVNYDATKISIEDILAKLASINYPSIVIN